MMSFFVKTLMFASLLFLISCSDFAATEKLKDLTESLRVGGISDLDKLVFDVDKSIKEGTNIDVENKNGQTPLHVAAHAGITKLVSLLLLAKADINNKDYMGRAPLHAGSRYGLIVAELLNSKANINAGGIVISYQPY